MDQKLQLVGLVGRSRSGKDTTADLFVQHGYKQMAFATNLKKACQAIFRWSDAQLYGDEKDQTDPRWDITPRQSFLFVGTDLFRAHAHELLPRVGSNIWVKSLEEEIRASSGSIVISDVRFPNEADMIRRLGGTLIKLVRPNIAYIDHESETHIDEMKCDVTLVNEGTIEELYQKVEALHLWT